MLSPASGQSQPKLARRAEWELADRMLKGVWTYPIFHLVLYILGYVPDKYPSEFLFLTIMTVVTGQSRKSTGNPSIWS